MVPTIGFSGLAYKLPSGFVRYFHNEKDITEKELERLEQKLNKINSGFVATNSPETGQGAKAYEAVIGFLKTEKGLKRADAETRLLGWFNSHQSNQNHFETLAKAIPANGSGRIKQLPVFNPFKSIG